MSADRPSGAAPSPKRVDPTICPSCHEPARGCSCIKQHAQSGRTLVQIEGGGRIAIVRTPDVFTHQERFSVAVIVGDLTTHRQIRDALPHAVAWQERLNSFQGPNLDFKSDRLLAMLSARKRAGITYVSLAQRLNRSIRFFIDRAADSLPELPLKVSLHPEHFNPLLGGTSCNGAWAPVWDSDEIARLVERCGLQPWDDNEIIAIGGNPLTIGPWHIQAVHLIRPFSSDGPMAWMRVYDAIRLVQQDDPSVGNWSPVEEGKVYGRIRKWQQKSSVGRAWVASLSGTDTSGRQ